MEKRDLTNFLKDNRYFTLLWTSQILSQVTLQMTNFIMLTRIYDHTRSTLAVSFLWVFFFLPSLLIGPFSGFFVDLFKRRSILFYTNLLQAITMLLFFLIGEMIYLIYPIVFLYSFINQFYFPAEAASIPWLVKKKDLPLANSLFILTAQTALILGFGVSGVLMRLFGKSNPVIISSALLLIGAMAVHSLPKNETQKKNILISFSRFWSEIRMGYSFIANTKLILFPLLMIVFIQVFMVVASVVIPDLASTLIKIDIRDAGPLLVVPLGVGALAGTLFISKFFRKIRKKTIIRRGLLGVALSLIFLAVVLPFLGPFRLLLAIPLIFFLGVAGICIYVPNQTLVQERTPGRFLGRVYGALGFFGNLITLPFLLFTASIVEILGIQALMILAGFLVFVGYFGINFAEKNLFFQENNLAENENK